MRRRALFRPSVPDRLSSWWRMREAMWGIGVSVMLAIAILLTVHWGIVGIVAAGVGIGVGLRRRRTPGTHDRSGAATTTRVPLMASGLVFGVVLFASTLDIPRTSLALVGLACAVPWVIWVLLRGPAN